MALGFKVIGFRADNGESGEGAADIAGEELLLLDSG